MKTLTGRTICPICLWKALKIQCCCEPDKAKRILILSESNYAAAAKTLTGKCPHRSTGDARAT
jgi:hypothetical protein